MKTVTVEEIEGSRYIVLDRHDRGIFAADVDLPVGTQVTIIKPVNEFGGFTYKMDGANYHATADIYLVHEKVLSSAGAVEQAGLDEENLLPWTGRELG